MKFPSFPSDGRITNEWMRNLQAYLRSITVVGPGVVRTAGGTFIRRSQASSASSPRVFPGTASAVPEPFQVVSVPITPVPTSGPLHTLHIYAGRVNEATVSCEWATPFPDFMDTVAIPTAFIPAPVSNIQRGAWAYVYLKVATRPRCALTTTSTSNTTLAIANHIPNDDDDFDYIPVAGVRSYAAYPNGTYLFEISQMHAGNIRHRQRLPMEVSSVVSGGFPLIRMKTGRVTKMIADMTAPSGWSDNSSYQGSRQFIFNCKSLAVPEFSTGSMSLWFALEYPRLGTRLNAANYGVLKFTATDAMPTSCPWVVVAEANANAEASRPSPSGDAAVPSSRPVAPSTGGGSTGGTPLRPMTASELELELTARAPAKQSGETDSFSSSVSSDIAFVEYGVNGFYTTITVTLTRQRDGVTVWSDSSKGLFSCRYTVAGWTASSGPYRDAANYYPEKYSDSVSLFRLPDNPNFPSARYYDGALVGVYQGTNHVDAVGSTVTTVSNGANTAAYPLVTGIRVVGVTYTSGQYYFGSTPLRHVYLYTFSGPSMGDSGSGVSAADKGPNENDSPGRNPLTPESSPTNFPPVDLAARDNAGNAVAAPGPGVWVWEIARIYPGGRVEQRHVGDILFCPSPQVQLRTNPKVAALP